MEIEGYIHDVSDMIVAKSGKRYFKFLVQKELNKVSSVISFSTDRRQLLAEREKSKVPVRLVNLQQSSPKRKLQGDKVNDLIMTKTSKVLEKQNLTFAWKAVPSKSVGKLLSICDIVETTGVGDLVSVKARVVSKGTVESVYSSKFNKELRKCDLVVADCLGAIALTLWEKRVEDVQVKASYLFSNLKVSEFRNICLNTSFNTTISPLSEDVPEPGELCQYGLDLLTGEDKEATFKSTILGVELQKEIMCFNCKKRFPETLSGTITCTGCGLTMLAERLACSVRGNIYFQCAEEEKFTGRYACSTGVLKNFFASLAEQKGFHLRSGDLSTLSSEEISATLLQLPGPVNCVGVLKL